MSLKASESVGMRASPTTYNKQGDTQYMVEEHAKKHALTPEMEARKWKPGQSGNPGGVPRGRSLTAVLRELLEQIPRGDTAKLKERIVKALLDKALRGDTRALDLIFERSDGKVKEELEVTEIQKIEYVPAKDKDATD